MLLYRSCTLYVCLYHTHITNNAVLQSKNSKKNEVPPRLFSCEGAVLMYVCLSVRLSPSRNLSYFWRLQKVPDGSWWFLKVPGGSWRSEGSWRFLKVPEMFRLREFSGKVQVWIFMNLLSWAAQEMLIFGCTFIGFKFCLRLSIFIFLAQFSLRSHLGLS